jgi:hypothetical protein
MDRFLDCSGVGSSVDQVEPVCRSGMFIGLRIDYSNEWIMRVGRVSHSTVEPDH